MRVISATLAPLPPSSSRISAEPSAKSYTYFMPTAVVTRAILPRCSGAQPDMRVVLDRLADRALGLAQRALPGRGRLGERAAQRVDEEPVGVLGQRERARLAGLAD